MMLLVGLGGNDLRDCVRPRFHGVIGHDAAAKLRARSTAAPPFRPRESEQGLREALRVACLEPSSTGSPPSNSSSAELLAITGTPHAAASYDHLVERL